MTNAPLWVRDSSAANQPLGNSASVECGAEAASFSVSSVAIVLFSLVHTLFLVSYHFVPKSSVPDNAISGGDCDQGTASAVRNGCRCCDFANLWVQRDREILRDFVNQWVKREREIRREIQLGSHRLHLARKPRRGSCACALAYKASSRLLCVLLRLLLCVLLLARQGL